jgi:hypothetical protein
MMYRKAIPQLDEATPDIYSGIDVFRVLNVLSLPGPLHGYYFIDTKLSFVLI